MSQVSTGLHDAALTLQVAGAAVVSWVVPEPLWRPLTRAIGRVETRWGPAAAGAASLPIDEDLAGSIGCSTRSLAIERIASGHASRLHGLREYLPLRRRLSIEVTGTENITRALEARAGAILWVGRFTWASLISKMGLHQAGFSVSHLSRPSHGFGTSGYAVRRLNPVWTRIEERFLRERVVLEPDAETGALRKLRRRLAENGVVSIAVGDEGVRTADMFMFGRALRMATGPVSLAQSSGASLLPVFAAQDASGRFRVDIDTPLQVPQEGDRGHRERQVVEEYARRLEPWVRRYPGQWLG